MSQTGINGLRVFVGPIDVAGIATSLIKGFHDIGVNAEAVLSASHRFQYEGKIYSSPLVSFWQKLGDARSKTSRNQLSKKVLLICLHNFFSWFVFVRVFFKFNAFIFTFGHTLTNTSIELWLLKRMNKKIIFIYVGSDNRPPYMDGAQFPCSGTLLLPSAKRLFRLVNRAQKRVSLHEKYADYLVSSPATGHFHKRHYINWFDLGVPKYIPITPSVSCEEKVSSKTIRILHSPSDSIVKGTEEIIRVIDQLRQKGHKIELIKIQGMSNRIVLQELCNCDFVVDQVYSDTPLAGFATEAAFFGKPAVVGGYFANLMGQNFEPKNIPPSLFVTPEKLEEAIEKLIKDTAFRDRLGEKARQFVLKRWNVKIVASRYLRLLIDDVPNHWWRDPMSVNYILGCGLPKQNIRRLIRLLVNNFGEKSLQVEDKPALQNAFMKFAVKKEEET